ncbi:ferredoxin-type protein NapF [Thioalkalivibrio paradoxus]|uniref:ferredoxin-type protein NapF n=1 Tax=Thioalkalivibrio paradoxus TaxID=108010 RepID=UPI00030737D9|nr:ferredoxin-type protein NapF [Thioalkalivibrio paradoxus]
MTKTNPNRAQFLRGRLSTRNFPLRPPWSLDEARFTDLCTRCMDCEQYCPEGIVARGSAGFPEVDFAQGGCTFCGDCVTRCLPGALSVGAMAELPPWDLNLEFTAACLARGGVVCRTCADRCVARAIRFQPHSGGAFLPMLDSGRCTGCGACRAACPVDAVHLYRNPGPDRRGSADQLKRNG